MLNKKSSRKRPGLLRRCPKLALKTPKQCVKKSSFKQKRTVKQTPRPGKIERVSLAVKTPWTDVEQVNSVHIWVKP